MLKRLEHVLNTGVTVLLVLHGPPALNWCASLPKFHTVNTGLEGSMLSRGLVQLVHMQEHMDFLDPISCMAKQTSKQTQIGMLLFAYQISDFT